HDLVAAARRDRRHRRAERSGADDRDLHFGPPIFRSLPRARRAMFEWCFTMMAMEMMVLNTIVQNGACVRKRRKSGMDAALRIEARETMRVATMTMMKMITPAATAFASSARNAPVAVATP